MSHTDPKQFYDDYVAQQHATGVNERHHSILNLLVRFGMQRGHRVLEIGCGIGTVSGLISSSIGPEGSLVSIDLSPKSVAAARARLADRSNVEFESGDALSIDLQGQFDVIVLPDVIEHIPLEHHRKLFSRIAGWLAPQGFVLLHYPNPWYLKWRCENLPDQIQPIDQPIHADELTANAYASGLYLDHLETYSIWIAEHDCQVAVLRRPDPNATFSHIKRSPTIVGRVKQVIRRLMP